MAIGIAILIFLLIPFIVSRVLAMFLIRRMERAVGSLEQKGRDASRSL